MSSADIGVIALARALEIRERGGKDIRDMPPGKMGQKKTSCTIRVKRENDIKCRGDPVSPFSPHRVQEDDEPPPEERGRGDVPENLSCEGCEEIVDGDVKCFEGTETVETFLETESELDKESNSSEEEQEVELLQDNEIIDSDDGKDFEGTIDALLETELQLETDSNNSSLAEDNDVICQSQSYKVTGELLEVGEKKKHVSWKCEAISSCDMAEESTGLSGICFNNESDWPTLGFQSPRAAESSSSLGKCVEVGEKISSGDKLTPSTWAERAVQTVPEPSTRHVPVHRPKEKLVPCGVKKGMDVSEDRGSHPTLISSLTNTGKPPVHEVQPVAEREGEEDVDNNYGSGTSKMAGRFLGKNGMLGGGAVEFQTIAGEDDDPAFGEWIHPESIEQIIDENPAGIGLSLQPTTQIQPKLGSDGSAVPSPVPEKSLSGGKSASGLNKRQMKRRRYRANAIGRCRTGCMTTDLTVQNVLILMCLGAVGGRGNGASNVIRHTRQWVLYCTACHRTTTPDPSRIFCPNCGNATLERVACSTDARTGVTRLHFRKSRQIEFNKRGSKYPLPAPWKPKKGKERFSGGILLREDQLMQGIWAQKAKISKRQNASSIFGEYITESVGICANKGGIGSDGIVVGFGKGNPNASKKGKGRERRGKTKR